MLALSVGPWRVKTLIFVVLVWLAVFPSWILLTIILAFKQYQSLRWRKIPSNRDCDVCAVVLSHGDGSL